MLEIPVCFLGGYHAPRQITEGTQGNVLAVLFRLLMCSHGLVGLITSLSRPLLKHRRWSIVAAWAVTRLQSNNDFCTLQSYSVDGGRGVQGAYHALSLTTMFGLTGPPTAPPGYACAVCLNFFTIFLGLVLPQLYLKRLGSACRSVRPPSY